MGDFHIKNNTSSKSVPNAHYPPILPNQNTIISNNSKNEAINPFQPVAKSSTFDWRSAAIGGAVVLGGVLLSKYVKTKFTPEFNAKIFNVTEKLRGTGLRAPKFLNPTTFKSILESEKTHVAIQDLMGAAYNTLKAKDVPHTAALSTAKALVHANSVKVDTHGIRQIATYLPQILNGKIKAGALPEVTRKFKGMAVINANEGLAYPAIDKGVQIANKLASKYGISYVTIENSHHCGEMGQFVKKLAKQGKAAIMGSTNAPTMAAAGGEKAILGTSPIAFAFPGKKQNFVADYALTKDTYNRVFVAAQKGETIPEGIILNKYGMPTTNAKDLFDENGATVGTMIAAGDHKGNLIAQLVELLSGASGGKFSFQAPGHMMRPTGAAPHASQFIIAIDPKKFQATGGDVYAHFQGFFDELNRTGGRVAGNGRDRELAASASNGVKVDLNLIEQLAKL